LDLEEVLNDETEERSEVNFDCSLLSRMAVKEGLEVDHGDCNSGFGVGVGGGGIELYYGESRQLRYS
jgi:hypothetical protein